MKDIITNHLAEMKLKVFYDYLNSYSCEIYYHGKVDGLRNSHQLKNEDGTWSNLIIPIYSLDCINNFEYNDEGYCDDASIKNLINELGDKISNNPIPERCDKIKIYYGDKNSEGEWDVFIVSCEINL